MKEVSYNNLDTGILIPASWLGSRDMSFCMIEQKIQTWGVIRI